MMFPKRRHSKYNAKRTDGCASRLEASVMHLLKLEVPPKWFIPSEKKVSGDKFWDKVEGWKNYVRMSEVYWGPVQ